MKHQQQRLCLFINSSLIFVHKNNMFTLVYFSLLTLYFNNAYFSGNIELHVIFSTKP